MRFDQARNVRQVFDPPSSGTRDCVHLAPELTSPHAIPINAGAPGDPSDPGSNFPRLAGPLPADLFPDAAPTALSDCRERLRDREARHRDGAHVDLHHHRTALERDFELTKLDRWVAIIGNTASSKFCVSASVTSLDRRGLAPPFLPAPAPSTCQFLPPAATPRANPDRIRSATSGRCWDSRHCSRCA